MDLKKMIILKAFLIIFILSIPFQTFASQVREGETVSFLATIWKVSGDYGFLIVNEQRLDLNPDTKVIDQEGKVLSGYSLKASQSVLIEAEYRSGVYQIKKIIIQNLKEGKTLRLK